jgi:hypothetical protein
VDGGLQVLLVAGQIRAQDERGQTLDPKELERKTIGKVMFKVESATVTTAQRIQIRKLLQKVGHSPKQGEELAYVPQFLQKMQGLADLAGGDAPKPTRPDTAFLEEIRLSVGNEQLHALYNRRDELGSSIDSWTDLAERIAKRWSNWTVLKRLAAHASGLQDTDIILVQVETIEQQRQLLEEPDPVTPLISNLTQLLRDELNSIKQEWDALWSKGEEQLEQDSNWQQLEPEQRYELRARQQLVNKSVPQIAVENTGVILQTLDTIGLQQLFDRIAAMPSRFERVLFGAAKMMEPEAHEVDLPSRTLKTEADVDAWLTESRAMLLNRIRKGPVIV